ncbi:MAG: phosphoenolpyruvate-utilizing N-terminal domain-containing protein, partial [Clostridiaceae bacterium]
MEKGIAVSFGYAYGIVKIKEKQDVVFCDSKVENPIEEKDKLHKAIENTVSQLEKLKEKTVKELGEEEAEIFGAHIMLAEDPEYLEEIETLIIDEKLNGKMAVKNVTDKYLAFFDSMEDEYMKERALDLKDVSQRIILNIDGDVFKIEDVVEDNTIIVSHDLTPSDTAELDKDKVIAFLTDIGGKTSHTAIMAKSLEIPAIVGLNDITLKVKDGDYVIVDGVSGEVIINPNQDIIKQYQIKKSDFIKEKEELKKLKNVETKNKDGKRIEISGNIGSTDDLDKVIENGG